MELRPGQVLENAYKLESLIGEGGMGAVWKATDTKLGRTVALKVLHTELESDPGLNSRFEREARLVASLEHPSIVPIYAWLTVADGQGRSFPCIVMPFVKGEPLADLIRRRGALSIDDAVKFTAALLGALSVAHTAGIIHRDLKPQNVMLDQRDGETLVRLLDFGIAKSTAPEPSAPARENATRAGMLLGTPAYMSPEQIHNPAEVDGRADLWAASVCFYEMVTGKIPFPGQSPIETLSKVLTNQGIPARQVNPHLPPTVDAFFNRVFSPRLEERPRTAKELEGMLQALVNNKSIGTGPWPPGTGMTPAPGTYAPTPPQPSFPGHQASYPGQQSAYPGPQASYPGQHPSYAAPNTPAPFPQTYAAPGTLGTQLPSTLYAAPDQRYPSQAQPGAWPGQGPTPAPGMYGTTQNGIVHAPQGNTGYRAALPVPAQQPGATNALSGRKLAGILGLGVAGTVGMGFLIVAGVVYLLVSIAQC